MLTIAYMTNRRDPRVGWFFDSLARETGGDYTDLRLIVVDYWSQPSGTWTQDDADKRRMKWRYQTETKLDFNSLDFHFMPPKPSVWQGPHRLTSVDYFAASNARNTAIAFAPDGYIAFVDDLSVLMPGWLKAVRAAQAGGYIALGAYKKVKQLDVENGEVKSFESYPLGVDSRWNAGNDSGPVPAAGSWMFGCSLAAPVEAFLKINGFSEVCDSMGGEDYIAGIQLERAGYQLKYDRQMLTLESEEAHHEEPPFKRIIKVHRGATPACKDASHAILQQVLHGGRNTEPNYFGPDGLSGLRQRVLAGEPFPICQIPEHHWPDSQPLKEM